MTARNKRLVHDDTGPDRKCSVQASYQPKWPSEIRLNVRFRSDGPCMGLSVSS